MADITSTDIKVHQYGSRGQIDAFPMAAVAIRGGAVVALNASGYAIGSSLTASTGYVPVGFARRAVDNSTGAAGDLMIEVERDFFCDNDTTNPITAAMLWRSYAYVVDNHTAGSSDVGGTLPLMGVPIALGTGDLSGKVVVRMGASIPAAPGVALAAFKARCVMTSLTAGYTGSGTGTLTAASTGAYATQDGLTLALGDVVFLQEGTTNIADPKDAGPWQVTTLGAVGVKMVFSRPSWYPHGGAIVPGMVIEIGGEGTGTDPGLAGTTWKSFAAKGQVIGTHAPVFWPRRVNAAVTLAAGTLASARTTIPVRALASTSILVTPNLVGAAPHASTRVWRASAVTPGVTGSSSVQVVAETAPGTTNASDVGTYNVSAINW